MNWINQNYYYSKFMFSAGHNKQSWQTDVILEDDICKKKWQLLVQIFQEFSDQQEEG